MTSMPPTSILIDSTSPSPLSIFRQVAFRDHLQPLARDHYLVYLLHAPFALQYSPRMWNRETPTPLYQPVVAELIEAHFQGGHRALVEPQLDESDDVDGAGGC